MKALKRSSKDLQSLQSLTVFFNVFRKLYKDLHDFLNGVNKATNLKKLSRNCPQVDSNQKPLGLSSSAITLRPCFLISMMIDINGGKLV